MVLELLEDSVVVMDAVVASSRDEGVHGRSLPDTHQRKNTRIQYISRIKMDSLDRNNWTTVVLQHQEAMAPSQVLQVLQVVLVFLPVICE